MAFFGKSKQEDLFKAEEYIRQDCDQEHISALVRHYHVSETTGIIEQFAGVSLTDEETANVVQKLRDEYGMGPIEEYNMPGYVEAEEDSRPWWKIW